MLKKRYFSFAVVFAAGCFLFCAACGGGNSSSVSKALTQAQLTAITAQMQQGLATSVTSITTSCPTGSTAQYCTVSTVACSGGGSITITSDLSGSLGADNSGQIDGSITTVPTNCSVTGSDLVINGDPSVVFDSTIVIAAGQLTSMTSTETGAISYGPDPSGVCQINLSNTCNFGKSLSCTVSGTMCGQTMRSSGL
jgi:hypothetical protein